MMIIQSFGVRIMPLKPKTAKPNAAEVARLKLTLMRRGYSASEVNTSVKPTMTREEIAQAIVQLQLTKIRTKK
jgi:hypothetical protein